MEFSFEYSTVLIICGLLCYSSATGTHYSNEAFLSTFNQDAYHIVTSLSDQSPLIRNLSLYDMITERYIHNLQQLHNVGRSFCA